MCRFRHLLILVIALLQSLIPIGNFAHASMPMDAHCGHSQASTAESTRHTSQHPAMRPVASCCAHGHCDCAVSFGAAMPSTGAPWFEGTLQIPTLPTAALAVPTTIHTDLLRPPITLLS